MADIPSASNIVTDPNTLSGVSRAIAERISPRAGAHGPDAGQPIEGLRLLLIDSRQARFVFGAPDEATLTRANLHGREALEKTLEEIFETEVRVELVVFNGSRSALTDLVETFRHERGEGGHDVAGQSGAAVAGASETSSQEAPGGADGRQAGSNEARFTGEGLNQVQLGLVQSNLRGVFTSPKRVVVTPGYLLRWIPYLGPLRTSIVVACFQAFYLSRGTTARAGSGLRASPAFEAPGPFLAALAGVAESSIWRHLDDPELGWFLKKVPYGPGEKRWVRDERAGLTKKRPTRFLFRSTSPLTPLDAQALHAYLADLNVQGDPSGVLTELVRGEDRVEPRDVFPFPAPAPPKGWQAGDPEACLIHNVIYNAIGIEAKAASKDLGGLVDELVERLLPANDQLHLSWYFLLHWQPLLGHGPGWATVLLRDRCFYNRQTGELRDTVSVRGGYQELASALGLQRLKTVREWFPAPHAQKEAVKGADLSSPDALEQIARSKRGFVREFAARFVEIVEAEADGRGQVSSFKARVRLFDPLTPAHEAVYNALYPFAQRFFSLPQEQKSAFLGAFDEICLADAVSIERIVLESSQAADHIYQKYGIAIGPSSQAKLTITNPSAAPPPNPEPAPAQVAEFLGAIDRITRSYLGANKTITADDPGANDRIVYGHSGAFESITPADLGGLERMISLFSGAIEKNTNPDPGAFERMGLVFWAHMRGLKHMVLNNHLDEAIKEYLQSTEGSNSTTTSDIKYESDMDGYRVVDEESPIKFKKWDLNRLLSNFSPHVKRELRGKSVTVEAVISCLLYIASSKGDNLGLGYVVEKLKAHPQEGQGGIYRRLAEEEAEEIVDRLRSYLEYRSFRNRDWRVAMGTPASEKILELLEHLGLDSSQFGSGWDWNKNE